MRAAPLLALAIAVGSAGCVAGRPASPTLPVPLVIGHRGAPGHLPEHTLASYALAVELGADCIEPDLVATRDGALVARHESNLTNTTDVATRPGFAERRRASYVVDGVAESGWFASDFTLAELRTLRARQAIPELRYTGADDTLPVPTFEEIVAWARTQRTLRGAPLCLYPELKHPSHHRALGLPLEETLVEILARHGLDRAEAPVFVQSFEPTSLERLDALTEVPLVQLVAGSGVAPDGRVTHTPPHDRPADWARSGRSGTYADLVTGTGLDAVARYADGIGVWKPYLLRPGPDGKPESTGLIEAAHARGLVVHAWTFRDEPRFLPPGVRSPTDELRLFFAAGVDGVFSDFPATAHAARTQYRLGGGADRGR